ncbi:efflux RND transporter periplasmic adaptor subunit, partial [Corynebacterium sp.]|uniref:efflux RND transporter periplasmic adaptor subunit n=1 Tax=Corynebacterium sp. TaxID=1720 RepID=UPI002A9117E6
MHHTSQTSPTVETSAHRYRSGRLRMKYACVAAVTATALFAAGCGIGGGSNGDADALAAGDYTIADVADVTNSVVLKGQIAPVRSLSITSPLQTKVTRLAVEVGDRVQADQFLVEMDTEELRRQIDQQEQQRAAAQAQLQAQPVSQRTQRTQGTSAPTMVYASEVRAVALPAIAPDFGSNIFPAIERFVPGLRHVLGGPAAEPAQPAPHPGSPAATQGVPGAPSGQPDQPGQPNQPAQPGPQGQALSPAELEAAQAAQAQEAAAAQAQAQAAQAAQAQLAQQQQLMAQGATAGSDGMLEYQVQQSTIYAPMAGVVASVDVQEGDIPQGKILTIADDSRLLIRSEVREEDVSSIKPGDRVTFTSTATGDKEFSGRVGKIAPVGSASQRPDTGNSGSGSGSGSVMFPIEIEVEGDT